LLSCHFCTKICQGGKRNVSFNPRVGQIAQENRHNSLRADPGRYPVLIFTRRIGEEIRIGDTIRVRIIDIKGKQVRLGINAPLDIIVHREEIYLRINEKTAQFPEEGNSTPKQPDSGET